MSIISPLTNRPYNGFQSLSGNETLVLRSTGAKPTDVLPLWCPTLDILAVPESLGSLRLVRLSGGQTVWRKTDNKNYIRGTAWHPQGTQIAVLYQDGALVQRSAASGDTVHQSKIEIGDESVAAMEWVQFNGNSSKKGSADPLPLLDALDNTKSVPPSQHATDESLNVIIVTTSNGTAVVSLAGIVSLPPFVPPAECQRAIGAKMDPATSSLYMVMETTDGQTSVQCLSLKFLLDQQTQLTKFASLFSRISGLFTYLDHAILQLIQEIDARDQNMSRQKTFLMPFEAVLQDHGVDEVTTPRAELTRLMIAGRASEATSQFLMSKLKATRLAQWETTSRGNCLSIIRLIYQHLQPAISKIIMALDELSIDTEMWEGLAARLEGYRETLMEEQRGNQEFVSWVMWVVEDLNWKNEGGDRPKRPEFDYQMLMKFIQDTFERSLERQPNTLDIPACQDNMELAKQQTLKQLHRQMEMLGQTEGWQNTCLENIQMSGQISDICFADDTLYIANIGEGKLQIWAVQQRASRLTEVDLQVQVLNDRRGIDVYSLRFFGDTLLGLVFAVDGEDQLYLATIGYSQDRLNGQLVFDRVARVDGSHSGCPAVLACNGRKGRRCVAVVERRAKCWWPFDMD